MEVVMTYDEFCNAKGHPRTADTRDIWESAQKAEREACAALCSETAAGRDAEAIEEAILARGEK